MKFKIFLDEAGKGPLAGPVVVGAISPLYNFDKTIFSDSKKLSEKKREQNFQQIQDLESKGKLLYSFGFATNTEIDKLGIIKTINLATQRCIIALIGKYVNYFEKNILTTREFINGDNFLEILKLKKLTKKFIQTQQLNTKEILEIFHKIEKIHGIIFDGNHNFGLEKDLGFKIITIVKGDSKVPYIGGASIIAKVTRDNYMKQIASKYPQYKFEKHKGYGTKLHRNLIKKYGICSIHRKTFTQNILNNEI